MVDKKIKLSNFFDTQKPIIDISSKRLVTAKEKDRLVHILNTFFSEKVRKIPVVDEDQILKGLVTSIDILNLLGAGEKYEVFRKNKESMDIRVEEFMNRHVKVLDNKMSTQKVLEIFKRERIGLFPILEGKKLVSVVSEWDFVKLINRKTGIKVHEAMVERPIFVQRHHSVFDVAKMMCRGGFRRLPIVENNILLGIVTPTDILLHLRKNFGTKNTLISDKTRVEVIMKKEPYIVRPEDDLFTAISIMKTARVGGLPVVDEEELVGIITERDVVDILI
jgi:CBS domain-containing protein